ncbi:MAG TPA: hypothetical protein VN112_07275 [Ensifer sp.]|nr:hypothetical protein [Ensifer sp.]
MQVSQNTASYASAPVAQKKGRELSKTQQAVQAQLAHNKQQAKVDADKLAKVSGKQVSNDATTSGSAAATSTSAAAAATVASTATAATTSSKPASKTTSAASTDTTQSTTTQSARKQSVFEKQHAYNQSMAKLHASMLDKVTKSDTAKTDATNTNTGSAAAAQAATAKYMENSGQSSGTTTTYFRA